MNPQINSNSFHNITPNFLPQTHSKPLSICNSVYGFSNSPKWVSISPKKVSNLLKTNLGSKFNLRVSKEHSNLIKCADDIMSSENGDDNDDAYYMKKGLNLARNALGCTSPNPMVGCVIVKDGKVVGQGFHPKAGQPHAEVFALRDAGELAENATAYVTLEPCNHFGKTPPCSEALIKAKVKKVVVGMVDPNPIVSSRGIDRLREVGIEVVVGVEEELCKKLNEAFIHKMLYKKPFVALRYSISINGVHSEQMGENVTECGGYYSKLLQEYDAVIHSPTSVAQNVSFLSSQEPNACQPLNIFIAKNHNSLTHILNLPAKENFKAIIFTDEELPSDSQISQNGIEIVVMEHLSMDAILDYCGRQGFCNVLVNVRGRINGLKEILRVGFEANLLQKAIVEVLPFFLQDEVGSSFAELRLMEKKRLKNLSTRISGDSTILEGYF
ncbi:hypothetical protein RND81_02G123300 [Saponaria officinalis]|uniref:Riboflavin biosynthesis protein PYRD, chloroplastic n=1 Tax=Saponaria officinalis TaxID=3572 RepID=A0AAW1MPI2_SAPOF